MNALCKLDYRFWAKASCTHTFTCQIDCIVAWIQIDMKFFLPCTSHVSHRSKSIFPFRSNWYFMLRICMGVKLELVFAFTLVINPNRCSQMDEKRSLDGGIACFLTIQWICSMLMHIVSQTKMNNLMNFISICC